MSSRSAASVGLQLVAIACVFAIVWIAFAHRIPVVESESMLFPLLLLGATTILLAWTHRASLGAALSRATTGTPTDADARFARVGVGCLVVVGFLLRLARTGEYGLNADEAQLVWLAAAETIPEMWLYERISPHPPGIFLTFHYMLKVSWELVWLRFPAVITGSFLIWISYRYARELFGTPAGVAMAWLVAFSPPIFELSRVARNYAPGFALIVVALFLLVRFFKTEKWRYLAWYALVAPLAVAWHYVFALVFAAMALVLGIELLRRRRPFSWWLAVAALHLPFLAWMGFLYFEHIAKMAHFLEAFHVQAYKTMLFFDPDDPLGAIGRVWSLLGVGGTVTALRVMSALGAVVLAINQRWRTLAICGIPLLFSLGFAWSGKIPLGGSRHSAYLFPFLFGLVVCHVPEILTGYRTTRENLARFLARARIPTAWLGSGSAPRFTRWAAAAACGLAGLAAISSMLDYNDEHESTPWGRSYHGQELVRDYYQADLERAFVLLEERVGPDDWVLLDFMSAYSLRLHLRLRPIVVGDEQDRQLRDISVVDIRDVDPLQRQHNGVRYYLSRAIHFIPHPAAALVLLRDVRRYYTLEHPRKIWLIRSAWSWSLMKPLEGERPDIRVDRKLDRDSRGMLFAIETPSLRRLGRRLAK